MNNSFNAAASNELVKNMFANDLSIKSGQDTSNWKININSQSCSLKTSKIMKPHVCSSCQKRFARSEANSNVTTYLKAYFKLSFFYFKGVTCLLDIRAFILVFVPIDVTYAVKSFLAVTIWTHIWELIPVRRAFFADFLYLNKIYSGIFFCI